jgi:F-type H+-transporting ATPase subunit delta
MRLSQQYQRLLVLKKIVLSNNVDESLIGGLIVKIGSKMIDNSIKTKLNRLEIAMRGIN